MASTHHLICILLVALQLLQAAVGQPEEEEGHANGKAMKGKQKPHIMLVLVDDWGWNNVGYHRPQDPEVQTPTVDALVKEGIELDRHYVYHYCSPSRASLQSGRMPVRVGYTNDMNTAVNPEDPVSGYAGIPRNMTGLAEKMRQGGYRTHATGKWDAGMATWDHTPMGRGYETWFGYYHHANDYYTQRVEGIGPFGCGYFVDLWNTTGPARRVNGTGYEEEMFTQNTLDVLSRHNPAEPLFLFHAFHQLHTPLQVPEEWEQKFAFIPDGTARKYAAMVNYMDHALGRIVAKLKEKGMWDNTLMVVSSDNGGRTYYLPGSGAAGASNLPLKGGKLSDWEGGVRVNAFVSGGAVPPSKRGTKLQDYIHIADWYTTLTTIAGVSAVDERAARAKLPPVEGIDHSALLLGDAMPGSGKRTEIHHSVRALTKGPWKLLTGGLMDSAKRVNGTGYVPFSTHRNGWGVDAIINDLSFQWCGQGCLYNVHDDPNEKADLAQHHPQKLGEMMSRLAELNEGVMYRDVGKHDDRACHLWDGFYGPFLDLPAAATPSPVGTSTPLVVLPAAIPDESTILQDLLLEYIEEAKHGIVNESRALFV